jgi:hypothetical protein
MDFFAISLRDNLFNCQNNATLTLSANVLEVVSKMLAANSSCSA